MSDLVCKGKSSPQDNYTVCSHMNVQLHSPHHSRPPHIPRARPRAFTRPLPYPTDRNGPLFPPLPFFNRKWLLFICFWCLLSGFPILLPTRFSTHSWYKLKVPTHPNWSVGGKRSPVPTPSKHIFSTSHFRTTESVKVSAKVTASGQAPLSIHLAAEGCVSVQERARTEKQRARKNE